MRKPKDTKGSRRYISIGKVFGRVHIFIKEIWCRFGKIKRIDSSEVVTAKEFFNYMERFDLDLKTKGGGGEYLSFSKNL